LQVGSYGFVRPTLDLTGPLDPDRTILYRLNAAYERFDGFRDIRQDVDRFFIAPVLAFRLSNATTLTLDFSYLRDERPFDQGLVAIGRGIVDIPINRFLGELDDVRQVEEFNVGYRLEHQFSDTLKIRNQFRFRVSDTFDFRAQPLEFDETSGILSRNFRSNDDRSDVLSLQTDLLGKFTTGSIEHNFLAGLDLRRQTSGGTQRRLPGGLTPSLNIFAPVYDVIARPSLSALTNEVRNNSNTTSAIGIVLQDQITLFDNLKLLLSGRFDAVSQDSSNNRTDETSGQDVTAFTRSVRLRQTPHLQQ
jgi:iron complex outermembrane receptor protein